MKKTFILLLFFCIGSSYTMNRYQSMLSDNERHIQNNLFRAISAKKQLTARNILITDEGKKLINRPRYGAIGYTPLHAAIITDDIAMVRLLLELGASESLFTKNRSNTLTPLEYAKYLNADPAIIALLEIAEANVRQLPFTKAEEDIIQELLSSEPSPDQAALPQYSQPPLPQQFVIPTVQFIPSIPTQEGSSPAPQKVLQSADSSLWSADSPLWNAIKSGSIYEITKLLKSPQGKKQLFEENKKLRASTPLHQAVQHSKPQIVKLLVANGAPLLRLNKDKFTPKEYAQFLYRSTNAIHRKQEQSAIITFLEKAEAQQLALATPHIPTHEGNPPTPLHERPESDEDIPPAKRHHQETVKSSSIDNSRAELNTPYDVLDIPEEARFTEEDIYDASDIFPELKNPPSP
jgi:hypothetical protein